MKLSALLLAVSSLISTAATAINNKLVVPTLRGSHKLKSVALDQAFQEHDRAYWKSVDNAIQSRKLALEADKRSALADKAREQALKTIRAHNKVRSA